MTDPAMPAALQMALASARTLAQAHGLASESLALSRTHGRVLARELAADGRPTLEAGHVLTPSRVAIAAAYGVATLEVARRPTVAVFTIGDRLIPPGMPRGDGQAYDSARELIMGLLRADGLEPTAWPCLPGDPVQIEIALRDAGCAFDLIVVCTPNTPDAFGAAAQVVERFGEVSHRSGPDSGGGLLLGHLDEACVLILPDDSRTMLGLYASVGRTLIDGLQGRRERRRRARASLVWGEGGAGRAGSWIPVRLVQDADGRVLAEPAAGLQAGIDAVIYTDGADGERTAYAWLLA